MQTSTFKRRISALVLLTFTSFTLQPLQAVAQQKLAQSQAAKPAPQGDDEQYAKLLDDIKKTAKHGADKAGKHQSTRDDAQTLRRQKQQLDALETKVDQDFAATEADLIAKHLPAEILARHRAAVADYKAKQSEFKQKLKALEDADDKNDETARSSDINSLSTWLEQNQKGRTHTKTDPNKLPFRTPDSKVRAPIETEAGFKTSLFRLKQVHLAGPIPSGGIQLAQALDPAAAPTAADLDATEDVQITQAIKDQAAQLNNNPVQIHNWVRNTIEYLPTYGSIQGSDMTLQTKRGNAFDTASLEIALLRAAGIPARYVYGTIQLPAAKAMNWVGGVTKPEAAQNLLGQGGIPNIGLVSGGQISAIKMEHVWVEAYVDYIPSRGAVNKVGDTWIPLDPSYKQYTYSQGMDIKGNVPLDAASLLTQAQSGATVNQTEGWVQNLNSANIQSALTGYQTQVKSYIDATKPNATVGDVLGSKTIQQKNYSILLGTLPYRTLAVGSRMDSLPDSLRWKYRTALYDNSTNYAMGSGELASLSQNTVSLAGKKITISFIPATQADTDLINSYLPKPHADGTPIQPSELPTSLPGYLLHLKAEIRVDGQVVMQGGGVTMGQELLQASAMFNPSTGQWEEGEANRPIAGEYHAIGLDLQGVGAAQLAAHKAKLEATKAKLEQFQANPSDTTPIQNLTKEDISGDLLYSGILGYFASVDGSDNLAARTGNQVVNYRMPSYGAFMAKANPHYWFGIVRSVTFPGVVMDVDRVFYQVAAKDDDKQKQVAYMRQVGAAGSAFEHAVPERLFADPTKPLNDPSQPQGVSAVKALAIAASQGQKIYTLNAQNQAYHAQIVAGLQIDADAKQQISDALNAGKEVTVHQAEITVNGWTGCGYILLDPGTGAGAYKISGGANGAILLFVAAVFLLIAIWPFIAVAGAAATTIAYMFAAGFGVLSAGFASIGLGLLLDNKGLILGGAAAAVGALAAIGFAAGFLTLAFTTIVGIVSAFLGVLAGL